jgi:hypothetical protein
MQRPSNPFRIGDPTLEEKPVPQSFAVTFDYRCPFARNAHEAVVAGVRSGADWDVTYRPFSLDQAHVDDGDPAVWDLPQTEWGSGVLALTWGLAIRDGFPERFPDAHLSLFAARHDRGERLNDVDVLRNAVAAVGLDPDAVAAVVATGDPLRTLAAEHAEAVKRWEVFGVPTFIAGDDAVFVRLMERGRVDDVQRTLDLLGWQRLNEFKRTSVPS